MERTITALRNLYVALGGDLDDVANLVFIPDLINAIADLISTQGIAALPTGTDGQVLTLVSGDWKAADVPDELPPVSATDNGSVLKVIEGVWAVGSDAVE